MLVPRMLIVLASAASVFVSAPAAAQFFIKPADLSGPRVTGGEPGITGPALPEATPDELKAALVWNLRAALNVAALQCQFEPTLLTLNNYNAILRDHAAELKTSYTTLEKYFIRVNGKNKKLGQTELDRFGTRVYSGFSTVSAQLSFCQTAAAISHAALFAGPGDLGEIAQTRMRELRTSLAPWGEQQFVRGINRPAYLERMPPFANETCWQGDLYLSQVCGPLAPGWGSHPVTASR